MNFFNPIGSGPLLPFVGGLLVGNIFSPGKNVQSYQPMPIPPNYQPFPYPPMQYYPYQPTNKEFNQSIYMDNAKVSIYPGVDPRFYRPVPQQFYVGYYQR